MKRSPTQSRQKTSIIGWVQYIGMVLAFISLWQLLSSGTTWLHRLL